MSSSGVDGRRCISNFRRSVAAARIHPNDPQRLSRHWKFFSFRVKLNELTQTSETPLSHVCISSLSPGEP
ncbi:hypothetical protein KCP78_22280 [Salmonella enterica subsp. enterica]|nr:hypothetical protein KCP78_22280 [Salmonella enterica subsp. enterica]